MLSPELAPESAHWLKPLLHSMSPIKMPFLTALLKVLIPVSTGQKLAIAHVVSTHTKSDKGCECAKGYGLIH
jgi:hypothetical protein